MAGAELRRAPTSESLLGNRLTVLLSGAAAGFGEGFVFALVMVPVYISLLTDNLVTIGFAPALGFGLWNAGALLGDAAVAGRSRRLPWSFAANLVRTGMIGLIAYIAYQEDIAAPDRLQSFLICYAVFAGSSGFASAASNALSRAALDSSSRNRVLHLRAVSAALLAAVAGVVTKEVLSDSGLSTNRAFGYIFIAAAAAVATSTFFAATVKETPGAISRLARMPGGTSAHDRSVQVIRRYVSIRVMIAATGMADGFLIVYGIQELGMSIEFAGIAILALAASTAVGMLIWSVFDRSRLPRTSLQIASFLRIIPPLIAVSIPYLESSAFYDDHTTGHALLDWLIVGAFVALGLAMASVISGATGYLAAMPPGLTMSFTTISNAALAIVSISGFLAGWVAERWGFDRLFAVTLTVSIVALLASGLLPSTAVKAGRSGPAMSQLPRALRPQRLSIR